MAKLARRLKWATLVASILLFVLVPWAVRSKMGKSQFSGVFNRPFGTCRGTVGIPARLKPRAILDRPFGTSNSPDRDDSKIARRFNAGKKDQYGTRPEGTVEKT